MNYAGACCNGAKEASKEAAKEVSLCKEASKEASLYTAGRGRGNGDVNQGIASVVDTRDKLREAHTREKRIHHRSRDADTRHKLREPHTRHKATGDESEWWDVGVITGIPPTPTPSRLVLTCPTPTSLRPRDMTVCSDDGSDDGSHDGASLLPLEHGIHHLPHTHTLCTSYTLSLSTPPTLTTKGC